MAFSRLFEMPVVTSVDFSMVEFAPQGSALKKLLIFPFPPFLPIKAEIAGFGCINAPKRVFLAARVPLRMYVRDDKVQVRVCVGTRGRRASRKSLNHV